MPPRSTIGWRRWHGAAISRASSCSRPLLHVPHPAPPAPGQLTEVAPGIHWLRLALPFALDHVNLYLVEDGDGTAVIDTGLGDAPTQAAWETLLSSPLLRARPLSRIVCTHYHPDHVGMVGWLTRRLGVTLLMARSEYLLARVLGSDPAPDGEPRRSFYRRRHLDDETTRDLLSDGHRYLRQVTGLPPSFHSLAAGDGLTLGRHHFEVLSGGGHSPEQIMLHCAEAKLLLCADQVLARISPNIGISAMDPDADPLAAYLRSLSALRRDIPADTLLLPGHERPFIGLHTRIDELVAHHDGRCQAILDACADGDRTVAELLPVMFRRRIDNPHQLGFAFNEAVAHVNRLLHQGRLRDIDGRYRTV